MNIRHDAPQYLSQTVFSDCFWITCLFHTANVLLILLWLFLTTVQVWGFVWTIRGKLGNEYNILCWKPSEICSAHAALYEGHIIALTNTFNQKLWTSNESHAYRVPVVWNTRTISNLWDTCDWDSTHSYWKKCILVNYNYCKTIKCNS